VILADGCFDPIHYGHLRYLARVREYGRPVVVRIAPDAAIVAKGRQPFQARHERAALVWALDLVDRVVLDDSLAEAITRLRPDALVKGIEWENRLPSDVLQACQKTGTRLVFANESYKTSSDRLRSIASQ
jgi:D-beta-D-heptose 7-phosphate kinase/D-beta-D-heptose 1-phosphate adenosyltransferase